MGVVLVFGMWERGEATGLKGLSQLGAELGPRHSLEHLMEHFP